MTETCFGDDILSLVQAVTGLPANDGEWVPESQIAAALRLLNKPLGTRPFAVISARLRELSAKQGGGWLRERRNREEREYAVGMGAIARLGRTQLTRLRDEFRAQMAEAEARARAAAADTPKRRFRLHQELVGVVEWDDDTPTTPSDLGVMLTLMITKLYLGGKIQPPPPESLIERLLTSVHELCCVGRTPSDILPTQPAAAPT